MASMVTIVALGLTSCGGSSSNNDSYSANNFIEIENLENNVTTIGENDNNVATPIVIEEKTRIPFPDDKIKEINASRVEYILSLVNKLRAESQDCGEYGIMEATTPLEWSDDLYHSAYEHSYDMANANHYSHDGSGTEFDWTAMNYDVENGYSLFSERIENNNIGEIKFMIRGENIAPRDSIEIAMNDWMLSDGHCKNIMDSRFKYIGLGQVEAISPLVDGYKFEKYYFTQNFGG